MKLCVGISPGWKMRSFQDTNIGNRSHKKLWLLSEVSLDFFLLLLFYLNWGIKLVVLFKVSVLVRFSLLASRSKPSDLKTCTEPRETEKCPSVPSRRISLLQISTAVPAEAFTNHDSQLKFEIMLPFSPCSSCVWLFVDISCPGNPTLTDINPEWSCFSTISPGCIRQLWWFVNFCDLYLFYVRCILWGWNQLLK